MYISLAIDRADPYRVGPFLGSTYPVHSPTLSWQTVSNAPSRCLLNSYRFKTGEPPQTIQLKQLQLLRDMRVQWNSTYFMINRLGVMRPV